jgi:hypothetical protein
MTRIQWIYTDFFLLNPIAVGWGETINNLILEEYIRVNPLNPCHPCSKKIFLVHSKILKVGKLTRNLILVIQTDTLPDAGIYCRLLQQ